MSTKSAAQYYTKNRKKVLEQHNRFRLQRQAEVNKLKAKPCMDCGGTFHPAAMDFDHRLGEIKKKGVARLANGWSLDIVKAEIAKCDLVCANCHRVRTYNRGYYASVH